MGELIETLLGAFQRHLRAEGRSERTILVYSQAIRRYTTWLAGQDRPAQLDSVRHDWIRDWMADVTQQRKPGTANTYYRGMLRFCGWLVAEDELAKHPMAGLKAPAYELPLVPVLSDADLAAVIKACAGGSFTDRRDELVIRLFLDCGVRVGELAALTVEQMDLDNMMTIVEGKGRKQRPVYWGARTARALDRYLRLRARHRHAVSPALLLSQRGPISPDGVRDLVAARGERAGLGHIHPHQFRHTNAHDFLLAGGQERDLKRLMGWSSDQMLARYGASAADVRAAAASRKLRRGDRV